MGKIAFIFPGQGSQKVGMGEALSASSETARDVFRAADRVLGEPLSQLCFAGPSEELNLTANTQPALLTVSVALLRVLGEDCDMAAGHSLGEYSAHVAAGTLDFSDAVWLLRKRGAYMQEAVPVGEGAMAAVLKAEAALVESICARVDGVVQPANYNSKGQVVISGRRKAVDAASNLLRAEGARIVPLPVSAPFHSQLMEPAERRLAVDLQGTEFRDPRIPVYCNVDAASVTSGDASRDALRLQVSRPVRWAETVQRMVQDGASLFVELGPGKVLAGLVRRIVSDVECLNVETPEDIAPVRARIRAKRGLDPSRAVDRDEKY